MLLRPCLQVCWRDGQDLWQSILPYNHAKLWPDTRTCLPPAEGPRPCILGCFYEHRPIGRKPSVKPMGEDIWNCKTLSSSNDSEEEEENLEVRLETSWEASYCPAYGCGYKGELLDLEKKGLWLELLESGEIGFLSLAAGQNNSDRSYQPVIRLLDANKAILQYFFHKRFPIQGQTESFSFWIMHTLTNIKKGIHFVFFDHSVEGFDSWPEQCGVCRPQSSVIVWGHP